MDDRKRQLPKWMLATSAADQIKEKVKADHKDSSSSIPAEEALRHRLSRSKNRKIKAKKEGFTEESSTQLLRCQTEKRSRRKLSQPNDDCNEESSLMPSKEQKSKNSKIEGGVEIEETTKTRDMKVLSKRKYGRMKEGSDEAGPSLRRQKKKAPNSKKENDADVEEPTPNTDDEDLTVVDLMSIAEEYTGDVEEDLTVEDLMSIAKEYVNGYEEAASGQDKGGIMEDAISMSRGSLSSIEVDSQFLRKEERNTGYILIPEKTIEDAPPPQKLINISGNPTQDMLDVFLGPLLKKTREEKTIERVRQEMSLAHELNQKKQRDPSVVHPVVLVNKKKSSLKDKIAQFWD